MDSASSNVLLWIQQNTVDDGVFSQMLLGCGIMGDTLFVYLRTVFVVFGEDSSNKYYVKEDRLSFTDRSSKNMGGYNVIP